MQLLPRRARRAVAKWIAKEVGLNAVDSNRGWFTLFESGETHAGGWQQDQTLSVDRAFANHAVYACPTLIASDVGKICIDLKEKQKGVWVPIDVPAFSPVLRKPNHYQTRQQFIECWVLSKLLDGNAYVLKVRDARKVVVRLYVLDPNRVTPLVADNGDVYYQLDRDPLSRLPNDIVAAPASEIIHDRMECLFHPLVGISPLIAANLAAIQGLRIQEHSTAFFKNQSRPGGMLTAPDRISDDTANRLKTEFEKKFSGENRGRLFVGGDGLEFKVIGESAVNSQLVEQLELTARQVCSAFRVPAYMIGVGTPPSYDNVGALWQQYYSQCLQKLYNAIEDLLDDGLALPSLGYRTEFDLGDLMRMDPLMRAEVLEKLGARGYISPNEGRAEIGRLPVDGGEVPWLQMQNYPITVLAQRSAPVEPQQAAPAAASKAANDEHMTPEAIASYSKGLLIDELHKRREHRAA